EPLPRVGVPAGLFHPVTVKQCGWPAVARDGLVEDPGEDRLLGPERLVDGRCRDRGFPGDRLDGGRHVPTLQEQPERGVHHPLTLVPGVLLPAAPGFGFALDWFPHTCESSTL